MAYSVTDFHTVLIMYAMRIWLIIKTELIFLRITVTKEQLISNVILAFFQSFLTQVNIIKIWWQKAKYL